MDKPRRHSKINKAGKLAEELTNSNLHVENKAGEKDAEFLKPGTKIKLAWRVTYKKK